MNSKDKKFFIGFMIIGLIIIIFIICKFFSPKTVYAINQEGSAKISNAPNVDVEEIIKQNNKKTLEQIVTEETDIEYITQYENTDELPEGKIQVIQEGKIGKQQVTKKITIDENGEKHEETIDSIVTMNSANKIVKVGTSKSKKDYKITKNSEV